MLKNVIFMLNVQNTLYTSSTCIKCLPTFLYGKKDKRDMHKNYLWPQHQCIFKLYHYCLSFLLFESPELNWILKV